MKLSSFLFVLVAVLALFGCSGDDGLDNEITAPSGAGVDTDKVMVVEGDFGNGSMYELHCPENWNGRLVI